jgi:AmiR/NasT family two-component response regulator
MTGSPTDAEKPRRVLVAEDEALIRLDLAEMLREEGYEVVGEAGDGQEPVGGVRFPTPRVTAMRWLWSSRSIAAPPIWSGGSMPMKTLTRR